MKQIKSYDVVIIGSGVSGMSAALFLKRAGINVVIVENNAPGGQVLRTSIIENYPGNITDGPTLASNMYNQIKDLGVEYIFDEVVSLNKEKIIELKNNTTIHAKYIIIATGRTPRKLSIENYSSLEGNGISYCALCDGNLYKNKNVTIVGGGSTAIEESLYLSNIASSVTIIHRNKTLKGEKLLIDKLKSTKNINIIYNSEIIKIEKNDKQLEILLNTSKTLKTNCLFVCIGYVPNTKYINDINTSNGYILVNKNYETNIKNIYAIGDIVKKEIYQIISATYEGCFVANKIQKSIVKSLTNSN